MGREFLKLMNSMVRLADEIDRQERKNQRQKLSEAKRSLREEKKRKSIISKSRKELAKLRGYIFENKDIKIKYQNEKRISGDLKDYIYYQFFALPGEQKEDLPQEQLNEIIIDDYETKAEWRANDIPKIAKNLSAIEYEEEAKDGNDTENGGCLQEIWDFIIGVYKFFCFILLFLAICIFLIIILAAISGG